MSCASVCSKHSANSRAREIQGRKIDREDYAGALGSRTAALPVSPRSGLPHPTFTLPNGNRVWVIA